MTTRRGGILGPWEMLTLDWSGREGWGAADLQESGPRSFGWYHLWLPYLSSVIWKVTIFPALNEFSLFIMLLIYN